MGARLAPAFVPEKIANLRHVVAREVRAHAVTDGLNRRGIEIELGHECADMPIEAGGGIAQGGAPRLPQLLHVRMPDLEGDRRAMARPQGFAAEHNERATCPL